MIRLGISDKKQAEKEGDSDLLLFYLRNSSVHNKSRANLSCEFLSVKS